MKKFNLKLALSGELCVARDNRLVRIVYDTNDLGVGEDLCLAGFVQSHHGVWGTEILWWFSDGHYSCGDSHPLDIVGMRQGSPQPRVTVTFNAPLHNGSTEVKCGDTVWYIDNGGDAVPHTFAHTNFCRRMIRSGQFFATKEDAQMFASAIKGSRR